MADVPASAPGSSRDLVPAAGERPRDAGRSAGAGEGGSPAPLTGGALIGAGLLLSAANFLVLLDTSIANVSVPNIAGGLGVSANESTWVITSYAVAEAITVPLTGWLSQRFGAVRVFTAAMFLFGMFSALCGLSPSLGALITFRVLQGLSGGPMIPLSQTLLLRTFPKHQAGQAMALWAMTTVIAPIAGPILGGTICDNYDWPWIFFINVPIALTCAVATRRFLVKFEEKRVKLPIDFVGLALLVVWVGALQIMLDKGEDADWFSSPFIVELAVVAVVGFFAFLIWELTEPSPIINLKVFASKTYSITLLVLCLCYGAYFASIVIQPLWLQTNLGYTATWAGYAVAPAGVLGLLVSPVVGKLIGKVDPRWLVFVGVLGMASIMAWRSTFVIDINFLKIALPQFVQGIFLPLFFIPVFGLALGALKPQDLAGGAGMLSFARTIAGAVATSLATTAWADGGRRVRVNLLDQLDSRAAVNRLAHAGLSPGQALGQFEGMVQGQAVMVATDQLFLLLAGLMTIAAFSIWLTDKPKGAPSGAGGH